MMHDSSIHKNADGEYLVGIYDVELPRHTFFEERQVEVDRFAIEHHVWPGLILGTAISAYDFTFTERCTRFVLIFVQARQKQSLGESEITKSVAKALRWKATDRRIKVKLVASVIG